jgi:hypothetical protein
MRNKKAKEGRRRDGVPDGIQFNCIELRTNIVALSINVMSANVCPGIRNTQISFTLDLLRLFCDRARTLRSERIFSVAGKRPFAAGSGARETISVLSSSREYTSSFLPTLGSIFINSFLCADTGCQAGMRSPDCTSTGDDRGLTRAFGQVCRLLCEALPLALVWSTRIQSWPTYPFLRAMMVLSAPWNRPVCPRSPGGAPQLSA